MTSRAARRKRRRRWLFAVLWAAAVLAGGTAASIYLSLRPERFHAWIAEAVSPAIRGLDFARDLEVNWWRLSVTAREVALRDPAGEKILIARRVAVTPRLLSLLGGRLELQKVVVDGPVALLVRRSDGTWNIEDALSPELFKGLSEGGGARRFPAVHLRGGRVSLREESEPGSTRGGLGIPDPFDLELSDIAFSAEDRDGLLGFEGEVRHHRFQRLKVSGTWDLKKGAMDCAVRATKVDLSVPIGRLLGEEASSYLQKLEIQGFADIERGEVHFDREAGLVPVAVAGRIIRCQFSPPGLPFPVKQLGGRFSVRGRTIELKDLEGWFGDGRIQGWANLEVDPARGIARLELLARAEAIPLDSRFRAMLEPPLRKVYDQFRPQGSAGFEIKVPSSAFPPKPEEIEASVSFNGVEFAFQDFPYPFRDLTGEAVLKRGRLELRRPLVARNRDATLTVTGHAELRGLFPSGGEGDSPRAEGPGPASPPQSWGGGEVAFEAKVENLSLDEELRAALPVQGRKIFDDFHPAGRVLLTATLRNEPGAASPSPAVFASLDGVRISYAKFPYEIAGIKGLVIADFQKGRVTLSNLEGEHAGQKIAAKGAVEWVDPGMLSIDISCDDLRVDESLKAALSSEPRTLIEDFRFRGRTRTEVLIFSTKAGETVQVKVALLEGEIDYELFPYPLELAGGSLKAVGPNSLTFEDVTTREPPPGSPPKGPKVRFNGGIGIEKGERLLDFHFDIQGLDVDDKLRNALPPELKEFVTSLGLKGRFQGELEGKLSYPLDQPDRRQLVYLARNVSADDAAVDFGVEVRHMKAEGSFGGGRDEKGNHYFEGEVKVKSASFNRLFLENGDITFTFGKTHPAIQAFREGKTLPGIYLPGKEILDRLSPDRVKDAFQMLVRRGNLYEGNLEGFLFVDVGREHDLAGEFRANRVDVAKASPDVFGASASGASGEAEGSVSFGGTTGDPLSILGKGEGRILRARLYQLPLFVALLNLFYLDFSTEHYFNEAVIQFQIRSGKFRSAPPDGIVIKSQGMHLKGGGTMDFEGNMDLALSPEFLRLKIPIVDQVLGLLKKGLAQVWIVGDIARPKVRFVTGGGILRIPIEAKPRTPDRPLPSELREGKEPAPAQEPKPGEPLPPPPQPSPPEKKGP